MAWIRSQDDSCLMFAEGISVLNNEIRVWGASFTQNASCFGKFSTEANALVELDAIQEWIENGSHGVYQISKRVNHV